MKTSFLIQPALAVMTSLAVVQNLGAADGKWNADASDNWSTASRWTNSQVADGINSTASFSYNITAARTVTLNSSRTIGNLLFEDITTSSHDWTLAGANTLTLQVSSGQPNLTVNTNGRAATISAILAGTQGYKKSGAGNLILSGANTISGPMVILQGELRLNNSAALGNISSITLSNTFDAGGTGTRLGLVGATIPASVPITMNSASSGNYRTAIQTSGAGVSTVDGPITVQGSGLCQFYGSAAGQTLVINGPITGNNFTGTLFNRGSGGTIILNSPSINLGPNAHFNRTDSALLILNTSGHFWGYTDIATGTLRLGTHNALYTNAPVMMGQSGTSVPVFDLAGYDQQVAGLYLSASAPSALTCVIGNSSTTSDSRLTYLTLSNHVFAGVIQDVLYPGTRRLGLTVAGGGALTLTGPNTYSGDTIITNAGSRLTVSTLQTGGGSFLADNETAFGVTVPTVGTSLKVATLALGNGSFLTNEFNLGVGNPTAPVITASNLVISGASFVYINGAGLTPGQFPLIKYQTASGLGEYSFVGPMLPPGILGYLSNNVANQSVDLVITTAPVMIWTGETNGLPIGLWDIVTTSNWLHNLTGLSAYYADGQTVRFDDTAAGTTDVTLAGNVSPAAVTVANSTRDYSFNGAGGITGPAGLAKSGAGTLTLATANTYSGDTLIASGIVKLGIPGALPDGAGKGNVWVDGALDLNGNAEGLNGLNGAGIVDNSSATPATLTLGNNNAYSAFGGQFQNTGGGGIALTKAGSGTIGLASLPDGALTLGGGTLRLMRNLVNNSPITLTAATVIEVDADQTAQLGGAYNGAFNLRKTGLGTLILTNPGPSSIASFHVERGTAIVDNVVMNNSAFLSIARVGGDLSTLIVKGDAVINANVDFNVGDVDNANGRLYVQDNAVLNLKNLWLGKNTICQGRVYQTGGLVTNAYAASSDWRLGGNGTAASGTFGGYYLSGGVLDVNANFQIGAYGVGELIIDGGICNTRNSHTAVGRYTNSVGRLVVSAGQFNQLDPARLLIIGENGTGTLVISNAGVVTLNGGLRIGGFNVIPATGMVTLATGGTLVTTNIAPHNVNGYGSFVFDGGVLRANGSTANYMFNLDAALVADGGAIIDTAGYDITIAQNLQAGGAGGLVKNGLGHLGLTGANTYAGNTVINQGKATLTSLHAAGGQVMVADGAALGVSVVPGASLTTPGLTVGTSGATTLDLNVGGPGNPSAPVIRATNLAVNGTCTVNILGGGLTVGRFTLIDYDGTIGGAGFAGLVLGRLPQGVVATLVDNTVDTAVELNITAANPLVWWGSYNSEWDINTTPNWLVGLNEANYTQVGMPGDAVIFDDWATTLTVTLSTNVAPASVVVSNVYFDYTFGGSGRISGPTSLQKQGAAALIMSLSNDYSGLTLITEGTLRLGASQVIPDGAGKGDVIVNGRLDLNGFNETVNGLGGTGVVDNMNLNLAVLTLGGNNATGVFSGLLASSVGPLAVAKTGTNQITLAGMNTYSGGTTVLVGTLAVATDGALGGGGVTVAAGAALATAGGSRVITNSLSGSGSGVASLDTSGGDLTVPTPISWTGPELGITGANSLILPAGSGLFLGSNSGLDLYGGNVVADGASVLHTNDGLRPKAAAGETVRVVVTNNGSWTLLGGANTRLGDNSVNGTNILEISSGQFTLGGTANELFVGYGSNSVGIVNQTGGVVQWTNNTTAGRGVRFGNTAGASGTYNLDGGTLLTPSVYQISGATGIFNFNGGVLKPANNLNAATFMQGLTEANVKSGGAIVDSAGFNPTIAQPLLDGGGQGGLTKQGDGVLHLNGANTYVGTTLVNGGGLGGTGIISGPVLVAANGTLSPGEIGRAHV